MTEARQHNPPPHNPPTDHIERRDTMEEMTCAIESEHVKRFYEALVSFVERAASKEATEAEMQLLPAIASIISSYRVPISF